MKDEDGYTLVELVLASAIMLTVVGAVMTLLHDGLTRTPVLEEATDLHQRARVAADALAADVRAAGSGTPSGPLPRFVPAVEPRVIGAPAGSASADALTIRYVPPRAARSRLVHPLAPASTSVAIDMAGCPARTTACGFTAGMHAAVFDASGHMDHFRVEAINAGTLVIDTPVARSVVYPEGSELAEAVEVSYALDAATRQLRRTEGGGTFAVADNVDSLGFTYLGDDLTAFPLAMLQDGPFRGTGQRMFDADLLRVRLVAATVRLASGNSRVPAVSSRITVVLRNGR